MNSYDPGSNAGGYNGNLYQHPFAITIALGTSPGTGNCFVQPGWVFCIKDGRIYNRCQVQTGSPLTNLGDPFLGETMPPIALQDNKTLWLKVEFTELSIVDKCSVVYETEENAKDSNLIRWIRIAKTYASGLVDQYLKENVFIEAPVLRGNSRVSKFSNTQVTVGGNSVVWNNFVFDFDSLEEGVEVVGNNKLDTWKTYAVGSTSFADVADGDVIYLKVHIEQVVSYLFFQLRTSNKYFIGGTSLPSHAWTRKTVAYFNATSGASYVKYNTTLPAPSNEFFLLPVAKLHVESGVLTIEQLLHDPVIVYPMMSLVDTHGGSDNAGIDYGSPWDPDYTEPPPP